MQAGAPGSPGKPVFPRPSVSSAAGCERSEKRRRPRQVALGLCDSRLLTRCIDVVRRNIENLIKLSQRFRETTKYRYRKSRAE